MLIPQRCLQVKLSRYVSGEVVVDKGAVPEPKITELHVEVRALDVSGDEVQLLANFGCAQRCSGYVVEHVAVTVQFEPVHGRQQGQLFGKFQGQLQAVVVEVLTGKVVDQTLIGVAQWK